MRVLAVGVDTVLARHIPDGRVVTLRLGRHSEIVGVDGTARQSLVEGDIVDVKAKPDSQTGTLKAKRITLVDVPAGRP